MAQTKKRPTSAKVAAGGAAGAIATLFWALAVKLWWRDDFTPAEVAFYTGLTTTIIAGLLGWLKAESEKYLKYALERRAQSPGDEQAGPVPPPAIGHAAP